MKKLHLGLMILIGIIFLAALAAYIYFVPTYRSYLSVIINPADSNNANYVKSSTNIQQALSTLDLANYTNKDGVQYSELSKLSYKVIVKPSDKSNIISIAVVDSNKEFAFDFVKAIANNIQSYMNQINSNSKTGPRENIEKQIAENEELLKQTRATLAKNKDSEGNYVQTKNIEDYKSKISTFQVELEPLADEIAAIKATVPEYFIKISEKNEAVLNALADYGVQLAYYIQVYDTDPSVSTELYESKEAAIKEAVHVLTASDEVTAKVVNYLTTAAKHDILSELISVYKSAITTSQDDIVSVQQLQSDISTYEAVIISLKQKLEETKITDSCTVMVVESATLDDTYLTTDRIVLVLATFFAGALIGFFIGLIQDLSSNTVTEDKTIRDILGNNIDSLGWIPYERNYNNIKKTDSYASERYRILANNINLLLNGSGAKVLSITSSSNHEGKTTAIVNLATNLARLNKKVMIVDADFRHPMVDTVFGIQPSDFGLTDVVTGLATKEQAIVVPVAGLSKLNLISAGKALDNATVIFNSDPFAFLINEFKNTYDYIFIDCNHEDFMLLSKVLDVYLLSVRAGVTTQPHLRYFNDERRTINPPLIGYLFYGRILNNKASDSLYDVYEKATRREHYPKAKGQKAPLAYAVAQQEAQQKQQEQTQPQEEPTNLEDEKPIRL